MDGHLTVFVIPKLCSRSTSCSFRMRTTHIWAGPSCSEPIGVTALVKHDLIVRIPVHTSSVPYARTLHPGAAIVCDTTIQYSSDALNHDTVQVAARDEPPTRAHARSRTLCGPDGSREGSSLGARIRVQRTWWTLDKPPFVSVDRFRGPVSRLPICAHDALR